MIFLTVGTQFPFDRLVKAIDELISQNGFKQKVFAQIGDSSYQPRNFEYVKSLEKSEFDRSVQKASSIVLFDAHSLARAVITLALTPQIPSAHFGSLDMPSSSPRI